MKDEELEKLYVDFKNHIKNCEATFRIKNNERLGELLGDSKFMDYGSELFLGGYKAAFEDLKRIGKL